MKKTRIAITLLLILAILTFSGCGTKNDGSTGAPDSNEPQDNTSDSSTAFSPSDGITDSGLWEGIKALDFVTLCEYENIVVPTDTHTVTDKDIQSQIDSILEKYAESVQVTDRALVDGDTVNIDYVGSVGGVEFEGGSTKGQGTTVTIGVTQYIDDFLEQLIGHTPGEEFDIEVTFPENYGKENLNGKDAIFSIKINYIVEEIFPELTDEFVAETLSETHSWTTVEEMKRDIHDQLQKNAIGTYVQNYLIENSTVSEIPQSVMDNVENSMLASFTQYAKRAGVDLETFLSQYLKIESVDDLLKQYKETNEINAKFFLIVQAIAEDSEIHAGKEDITAYFSDNFGKEDYSQEEAEFGLPYLAQVVLLEKTMNHVIDNSTLE